MENPIAAILEDNGVKLYEISVTPHTKFKPIIAHTDSGNLFDSKVDIVIKLDVGELTVAFTSDKFYSEKVMAITCSMDGQFSYEWFPISWHDSTGDTNAEILDNAVFLQKLSALALNFLKEFDSNESVKDAFRINTELNSKP